MSTPHCEDLPTDANQSFSKLPEGLFRNPVTEMQESATYLYLPKGPASRPVEGLKG